ncbi:AAA family ATPase [Rothia uropygialis]|uniref:AAA family ATPase n=1 Tax=Kocuria sp. 36 TaxID=1415402 RepID=UPI00101B8A9B|nr:SMC family ATPase [Kocuria sp. 36]
MRIHHLELCAFGPFPGKEKIDFQPLNSAGIFLLSGPTGAGKSTIFDAICFALYGSTTRPENSKGLYSDFARPGTAPYVELELTVGNQRYRIRRSPEWSRPSQRAKSGWVTQNAQVTLSRCPVESYAPDADSEWEVLSVRHDEAGKIINEIFGLSREQFAQVVMLPQGQFARFLSATSDEREKLLRRLFPVELYSAIRDVLKDRSDSASEELKSLTTDVRRGHVEVASVLKRLEIPTDGLLDSAGDVEVIDMQGAASRLEQAAQEASRIRKHLSAESTAMNRRADALERGLGEWAEHDRLVERRQTVSESEERVAARRRRVEAAERAVPVEEARRRFSLGEKSLAEKKEDLDELRSRSRALLAGPASVDVETAEERRLEKAYWSGEGDVDEEKYGALLDRRRERVHELLRRVGEVDDLEASRQAPLERREELRKQASEAASRLETIEQSKEALSQEQDELALELKYLPEASAVLAESSKVLELTRRIVTVRDSIRTVAEEAEQAEKQRQRASHRVDDLMSRRFEQAVRVLADELQDDRPCPVCGSKEHPSPAPTHASSDDPLVSEEILEQAAAERKRAEERAKETFAQTAELKRVEAELRSQGAMENVTDAESAVSTATWQHQALVQKQRRFELVERQQESITEAIRETESRMRSVELEVGVLDSRIKELDGRYDQALKALKDVPPRHQLVTIQRRIEQLRDNRSATAQHRGHVEALRENARALQQSFEQALSDSGFENLEAVEKNLVEPQALEALRQEVRRDEEERARLDEAWNAPWHQALLGRIRDGETRPEPEGLDEARRQAEAKTSEHEEALSRETVFREGLSSIKRVTVQDETLQDRVREVAEKSRRLKDLADVASGIGGENQQRMSLTTFVLAAALEEIADAATVRLREMTNGRFSIQHTDAAAGKNRKSGLGLEIFDAWTSEARPTTSLSGGETFMASLCLALGLADVVQARAGGIEVDTLFVDEGFGSLDEDTLDGVMDAIDGLRENGRVIGLVSHVADMKTRIPQHVRIKSSPSGSSLESKTA